MKFFRSIFILQKTGKFLSSIVINKKIMKIFYPFFHEKENHSHILSYIFIKKKSGKLFVLNFHFIKKSYFFQLKRKSRKCFGSNFHQRKNHGIFFTTRSIFIKKQIREFCINLHLCIKKSVNFYFLIKIVCLFIIS